MKARTRVRWCLAAWLLVGCQKQLTGTPCPCVEEHVCCPVARACYPAAECPPLELRLTEGTVSAVYGNATGGAPFTMQCAAGEAVIGMRGIGREEVYGFGLDCGKLDLALESGQFAVQVAATSMLPQLGGNTEPPGPSFTLACPAATFVTSVAGTTWLPANFGELLQTLTIGCSSAAVAPDGKLAISPPVQMLAAGVPSDVVETFSVDCPDGMVDGMSGNSGALIDAVAIHCTEASVVLR